MNKDKFVIHTLVKPTLKMALVYGYRAIAEGLSRFRTRDGSGEDLKFKHEIPRRFYRAMKRWSVEEQAHVRDADVSEMSVKAAGLIALVMDVEQGWCKHWWLKFVECLEDEGLLDVEKVKLMKETVW